MLLPVPELAETTLITKTISINTGTANGTVILAGGSILFLIYQPLRSRSEKAEDGARLFYPAPVEIYGLLFSSQLTKVLISESKNQRVTDTGIIQQLLAICIHLSSKRRLTELLLFRL